MEVVTVRRDPFGAEGAFALILDEKGGHRRLKIIIAHAEAQAIAMELERYTFRRPLTHDLLMNIVHALEAQVLELNIHKLEDNTFFAYLLIESATGQVLEIDCRPSDGVAIALKARVPIYCEEEVLEMAGTTVEPEEEEEPQTTSDSSHQEAPPSLQAPFQQFIEALLRSGAQSREALLEKLGHLSAERKQELTGFLEKILRDAIRQENYELAAQIRDIIQRLNQS